MDINIFYDDCRAVQPEPQSSAPRGEDGPPQFLGPSARVTLHFVQMITLTVLTSESVSTGESLPSVIEVAYR